jgi:hypothetical protein
VVRLNDTVVGDGRPGPVWKHMIALFQAYKDAIHRGEAA